MTLDTPNCVEAIDFYTNLLSNYSPAGLQDVVSTRATYFAGQAAMIVWSPFIMDEMAGLRDAALPTCTECADNISFLGLKAQFELPPYVRQFDVGLLPFVIADDRQSVLVHASQLARHSRGLQPGSPFSILIHAADHPEADPLQVTRVSISGTAQHVSQADADYEASREAFIDRFPSSELTFTLGDFNLYRLHFERGRLVSGFARAITLGPESFEELTEA